MLDFTYRGFSAFISHLKENDFVFCSFYDYLEESCIVLRHDVDFSLEEALVMAKLESRLEARSTYFVLLSSPFYNIFNIRSKEIINHILELNHDIGLHFDPANYQVESYEHLFTLINNEISILNGILDRDISFYSFHRPASNPSYFDQLKCDERYVHSDKFESLKYISDSRMHFRENIFSLIKNNASKSYQINLHPIWYKQEFADIETRLLSFVKASENKTIELVEENINDFHFSKLKE